MPNVQHAVTTDPDIHEPKGASTASAGMVYVADGAGSGTWTNFPLGWGSYLDTGTGAQAFTTSASILEIDGGTVQESYLPRAIRGSGSLWDTTNDLITPIADGDNYAITLSLPVTALAGSPTRATVELDIGGTSSPSNVIATKLIDVDGTPTYTVIVDFIVSVDSTFLSNGAQFFITTDTGTVTITDPEIIIFRLYGNI